jgi:hypothetical protein
MNVALIVEFVGKAVALSAMGVVGLCLLAAVLGSIELAYRRVRHWWRVRRYRQQVPARTMADHVGPAERLARVRRMNADKARSWGAAATRGLPRA